MSKVIDFFRRPQFQIELATGISIVALAWFFKKVVGIQVPAQYSAIPALILCVYEGLKAKKKWPRLTREWIWITAVLLSTALIILFHVI